MTRTMMSDATMGLDESAQSSQPDRLLAKALASGRPEPRAQRVNRPDNSLTCENIRADGGTRTPNPLFTRQVRCQLRHVGELPAPSLLSSKQDGEIVPVAGAGPNRRAPPAPGDPSRSDAAWSSVSHR